MNKIEISFCLYYPTLETLVYMYLFGFLVVVGHFTYLYKMDHWKKLPRKSKTFFMRTSSFLAAWVFWFVLAGYWVLVWIQGGRNALAKAKIAYHKTDDFIHFIRLVTKERN